MIQRANAQPSGPHTAPSAPTVARVTESDDVHDLEESDFIVRVAKAIGASREEYAGLTITLEESVKPPPLPGA